MVDLLITPSSGNVFADLGIPYPEIYMVKAQIAYVISDYIRKNGLTQKEVSDKLGVTQPRISNLIKGRLDVFSIEMLLSFCLKLNLSFEIQIK